jgi:hypothetical protein
VSGIGSVVRSAETGRLVTVVNLRPRRHSSLCYGGEGRVTEAGFRKFSPMSDNDPLAKKIWGIVIDSTKWELLD